MKLSLSIVLMTVLMSGTIHFFLIRNYINNVKTEQLKHEMDRLENITENLAENYSPVNQTFYQVYLNELAENNKCYVIVADNMGNILSASGNCNEIYPDNVIDEKKYKNFFEGKEDSGSVYVATSDGKKLLSVTNAISLNRNIGIVAMLVEMPFVSSETYSVMSLMLISIGLSTLLSLILSYFLSLNMSKPIKRLSLLAKEVAKGKFSKRSVVSGVAELDELGEAFDKMAGELDRQEKSRTDFLANVSHDLRTPMTTISGFVQGILDDTIPQEKEKEYLKVVLSETNRLSDLINMFLDANRYESGDIKLDIKPVNITEMLTNVLLQFEGRITEKNINVSFEVEDDSVGMADHQAINRVVVNLMDNAVKFCTDGGNIKVSTVKKNKKLFVSIENSGEISKEDINYIWDRFYKTDKSRIRDKKGVGLGLYIVKNIISQHGEQIVAESENGTTKFTFSLKN